MTSRARLAKLGVAVPEVMVPGAGTDPRKWSVIACDQFSSEPAYWEETRRLTGNSPSVLDLIIPECYLDGGDLETRVKTANEAMRDYVRRGVLKTLDPGFILVDRSTPHTPGRRGLVLAIDLEFYDFSDGSRSAVRPTEGTIRDRLPPRMAVRRRAVLDIPHILILIDDPGDTVMAAAEAAAGAAGEVVYDFDLMQEGGHVRGRHIPESVLEPLAGAFESLAGKSGLLFAVGDGNHSLASAREIWLENKARGVSGDHPSRYALVEVENIHDPGLHFHPIHRVLFNIVPADLKRYLDEQLRQRPGGGTEGGSAVLLGPGGSRTRLEVPVQSGRLEVEVLQAALDSYLAGHPVAQIDYIHGEESVVQLVGKAPDRLGLLLPDLDKGSFFRRISEIGPYPRKTFSIGEAVEKRYYLEARLLETGGRGGMSGGF